MDPTQFDDLVKSLAATGLTRRHILRGLGGSVATLATLNWRSTTAAQGNSDCAHWCNAAFPPGPVRGQCKSEAAKGRGVCYECGPQASSDSTLSLCGTTCVEQSSDANNCNACGNICSGTTAACCDSSCTDLNTDRDNCGRCGKVCDSGEACQDGSCVAGDASCPQGRTLCDTSCVELSTDVSNCNDCNNACQGTSPACCESTCRDLSNDANNCNACGNICSGTSPACCDSTCADLSNDAQNCGQCGKSCNANEHCDYGICRPTPHACSAAWEPRKPTPTCWESGDGKYSCICHTDVDNNVVCLSGGYDGGCTSNQECKDKHGDRAVCIGAPLYGCWLFC